MYPYPSAGRGRPAQLPSAPIAALERFLMESLPVAAVAHSYHVEVMRDPRLQRDPTFQRFNVVELNELHHQIAALGALLRLQEGDPTAAENLAYNLAGFLQNRQLAMQILPQLPAEARRHPAMQRMLDLIQVSNQQLAQNRQLIDQVLAMAESTPGPLMARCPR